MPSAIPTSPASRSAIGAYLASELGASASEYALTLLILGGCAAVMLHALAHRMSKVFSNIAVDVGGK